MFCIDWGNAMCDSRDLVPVEWLKEEAKRNSESTKAIRAIIRRYRQAWDKSHAPDAMCYACAKPFQWTGPSYGHTTWFIHTCGAWNDEEGAKERFRSFRSCRSCRS